MHPTDQAPFVTVWPGGKIMIESSDQEDFTILTFAEATALRDKLSCALNESNQQAGKATQ
jgi:hypothetical protein